MNDQYSLSPMSCYINAIEINDDGYVYWSKEKIFKMKLIFGICNYVILIWLNNIVWSKVRFYDPWDFEAILVCES